MSDDACLAPCGPESEEIASCYSLAGRDFCQRMTTLLLKQLRTLEERQIALEELSDLYNGQGVSLNIQSVDEMIQYLRETIGECLLLLNGSGLESEKAECIPARKVI